LEQQIDAHFTSVVRQCRPSSYIGHDKEVRLQQQQQWLLC
jgi:hypothetical protein